MNDAFCVTRPGRPWRACGGLVLLLVAGLAALDARPAAAQMRVGTGSYFGDGVAGSAITVGFQPDVVIVRSERGSPAYAGHEAVARTSTMGAGDVSRSLVSSTASETGLITSLTATGFTVGADIRVNQAGVVYYWTALKAAAGELEVGTYTGNSTIDDRLVPVAFQPDWVLIVGLGIGIRPIHRSSAMTGEVSTFLGGTNGGANQIQDLTAAGFVVGTDANVNGTGVAFHYVAVKKAPGRFDTGMYEGDVNDNRNITGIGFEPLYVIVKTTSSVQAGLARPTELTGDQSLYFTGAAIEANKIQALLPDGFQVGLGANVNAGAGQYYMWVAFGNTATPIYYSVGTNALALYSANASASSGTLTLAGAAADNVGVGDEIRVGLNRYYITGRTSSTVFSIQDSRANGGTPGATNITFGSQAITIYRAFNTLSAAHTGSSNATHLNTTDLVAGNYQLNWPCYADAAMPNSVRIQNYTTGPTNYIRVYTPRLLSEVGTSQRHSGVFGTGFQLNGTTNTNPIQIDNEYVRIEGLVVQHTVTNNTTSYAIWSDPVLTTSDVRISHNIVKGVITGGVTGGPAGIEVGTAGAGQVFRVWNNVVYNYPTTNSWCMSIDSGTAYVFNNTVFNCYIGIGKISSVAGEFRNNVSINDALNATFTDYVQLEFTAGVIRSDNVSSDTTSTLVVDNSCATCLTGKTVYATYFKNTTSGTEDFHLRNTSLALWTANGTSLSGHAYLAVTDDIDNGARVRPDIGADEFSAIALFRSVGTTPSALATGGANALTISGSTATFASALPDNIGVGDVIQYDANGDTLVDALAFIHGRTSSRVYTVKNKAGAAPTAVTGDDDWDIYRAYTTLANWEVQAENVNITEPAENDVNPSVDLVGSGTVMLVTCYVGLTPDTVPVNINGWNTGPETYISIFTPVASSQVGTSQRHSGTWDATKYRLVASALFNGIIQIQDEYVRVTGLQIENTGLKIPASQRPKGIEVNMGSANSDVRVDQNILRNTGGGTGDWWAGGIVQTNGGGTLKVWNNIMYDWGGGVFSEYPVSNPSNVTIYNNTIINSDDVGIDLGGHASGTYRLANNLVQDSSGFNYYFAGGVLPLTYSATNLSQDATSPDGAAFQNKTVTFVGAADFHLSAADVNAKDLGTNLSTDPVLAVLDDIDGQVRQVPWDIGADDGSGTTAVKLMSFVAVPGDGSVTLEWRTGSELDNLGFHLHRGLSANGPWARLTSTLIQGLGSSPLGQAYSWLDSGLTNGVRYYYRLEDVDTASKSTFHGPVSTVPSAPAEGGGDDGGADGTEPGEGEPVPGSCPTWVLSAAPDAVSPTCTRHGDPEAVSLNVLSRSASGATLELRTGGFWTLEDGSGTVRVFVPGLEFPTDAKAPALPLRRALVEAVIGKQVHLVSAEAFELQSFPGLRPSAVGQAEMSVSRDGTVRPARRSLPARFVSRGFVPKEVARLAGTVFQGERKSAVVEITPVRFDGSGQKLVRAGRVRVRLAFAGVAEGEIRTGSGGRALPRRGFLRDVLAHLHTTRRGLHAVRHEALFPTDRRGLSTSLLRLQRQGEAVPFHVEPAGSVFGPGGVLYFFADRTTSSTEYSSEVAYELVRGSGVRMGVVRAQPAGAPVVSPSTGYASFETNRIYQPGLLEAPDLWLWDGMVSGAARAEGFTLSGVDTSTAEMARLAVHLQGGSESGVTTDHHVRLSVNGAEVGEATFAGKRPYRVDVLVPASQLREGANELGVVNVGDTGVSSLVFLDRFEVSYPQAPAARQGVFEGEWAEGGTAQVSGLTGVPVILRDVRLPGPEGSAVRWVTGFAAAPGSVRFQAEAGHRYLVVSPEGLLRPRIGRVPPSTLKAGTNQADYLVIAPREFLEAAQPLLERRRSQGLVSRAVPFEEIASEFGRGQPSAEAIKAFLSHVYHSWQRPSPRYVLLLGDATYDPQRFVSTSWVSPLPALWAKTSYLWTASDPALAAVNGDDSLPDLAIGRLPATTVEQAEALVGKLLAWEDSGQDLSGRAVLVADNPDLGGDFEADVEDVRSSFLAGRSTTTLKLSELGVGTRPAILDSFDDGASLMSYVGHGGAAVWASENVLNSWDTPSLRAQSRQPLLLTMNCLNGYFVASNFDALSEALVKAEGRGAVAAFSPSGLSLDGPAHQYHRALMAELTSGRHERLGDAILAAQLEYARAGTMPELLSVYHLLGDPGMRIR